MPSQNDFVRYMGQPPNSAWGPPPQTGYMGPSSSWIGSPPVAPQYIGLGQILQPYLGNIGAVVGNFINPVSFHPYFPSHMNIMQTGRSLHQIEIVQQLMQTNQQLLEERIRERMRHLTPKLSEADLSTGLGKLLVDRLVSSEFMQEAFRTVSARGAMALTGALSAYGNAFRPSAREVSLLQTEFYNYYGMLPGQDENINRTYGLSLDELAEITNVTSHMMGLSGRRELFNQAEKRLQTFHRRDVGDIVRRSFRDLKDSIKIEVSQRDWEDALVKSNYNIPEAIEHLGKQKKLTEKEIEEIHTRVMTDTKERARQVLGTENVSIEGLAFSGMVKRGDTLARAVKTFKDAGYQGSVGQLLEELEGIIGSERFDISKLQHLADNMRTLTKVTGMTLDSLFGLFETIDKSVSGGNLGVRRAAFITTVAATTGLDLSGSVSRTGMALYQHSVAEAAANPAKSNFGMALDVFRLMGRNDIVQQYHELPAAQRQAWLRSKIVEHSKDNPLLQALLRGDTDLVMTAVRDIQSEEDRTREEYDALKKSSDTWSSMTFEYDFSEINNLFSEAAKRQGNISDLLREAAKDTKSLDKNRAAIEEAFGGKISAERAVRLYRYREKADRLAFLSKKAKTTRLSDEEQAEHNRLMQEVYTETQEIGDQDIIDKAPTEASLEENVYESDAYKRYRDFAREAEQRNANVVQLLSEASSSQEKFEQHRAAIEDAFGGKLNAQQAVQMYRLGQKIDVASAAARRARAQGATEQDRAAYQRAAQELQVAAKEAGVDPSTRRATISVGSAAKFSGASGSAADKFLSIVREAQARGMKPEDMKTSADTIRQHAKAAAEEVKATMPKAMEEELRQLGESLGATTPEDQIRLGAAYVAMKERSAQLQKQTGQIITHDEIMKVIEDSAQQQGIRIDKSKQKSQRDIVARAANATSMARMAYGTKAIDTMTVLGYSEQVAQWDQQKQEKMKQHASLIETSSTLRSLSREISMVGYDTTEMQERLKNTLAEMKSQGTIDEATQQLLTQMIEKKDEEGLGRLSELAQVEAELSAIDRTDPNQQAQFNRLSERKAQLRQALVREYGVSTQTLDTFVQKAQTGAFDRMIDTARKAGVGQTANQRLQLTGQLLVKIREEGKDSKGKDKEKTGSGELTATAQASVPSSNANQ